MSKINKMAFSLDDRNNAWKLQLKLAFKYAVKSIKTQKDVVFVFSLFVSIRVILSLYFQALMGCLRLQIDSICLGHTLAFRNIHFSVHHNQYHIWSCCDHNFWRVNVPHIRSCGESFWMIKVPFWYIWMELWIQNVSLVHIWSCGNLDLWPLDILIFRNTCTKHRSNKSFWLEKVSTWHTEMELWL